MEHWHLKDCMENPRHNSNYIHHQNSKIVSVIREVVFGVEDGMVSTLGAITGIAVGSQDRFTVILAGCVIIAVESISMGIGSYISNLSDKDIKKRKLYEEKIEIEKYPVEEARELTKMYIEDGWPKGLAEEMSLIASKNKKLMLQEMAYRELNLPPEDQSRPLQNGVFMFFAYIVGGLIPLLAYFFLPLSVATLVSVVATLLGLFLLGVATTRYTKKNWFKAGLKIFILGSVALLAGVIIGKLSKLIIN